MAFNEESHSRRRQYRRRKPGGDVRTDKKFGKGGRICNILQYFAFR